MSYNANNSIREQLISTTDQKLAKMFQDKKQTPSLIIPKNLPSFIKTQQYKKFLFCIYEYCTQFNQLIKKYKDLKEKMKERVSDQTVFLQKQKQLLTKMQKQLSYYYAAILLGNSSKTSHKDHKQQFFFQTLIYLISKVIKEMFSRQQFLPIEQEINRLFRTNRFNIIKRRHEKDIAMKEFPALKDNQQNQKVNLQTIINKAPQQISAYRMLQKKLRSKSHYMNDYSQIMGITEIKDQEQRSPLICTWLPSKKNMLSQFKRPKYTAHLKVSSGKMGQLGRRTLDPQNVQNY